MMQIPETEPSVPGPSALFPEVEAEWYEQAGEHAEKISTDEFACDADDVLLAATLSRLGVDMIEAHKDLQTKALRRLYDARNTGSTRAMISIAKMLRATAEPTPEAIQAAALRMTSTLAAVLVAVAPDHKKIRKHPGG